MPLYTYHCPKCGDPSFTAHNRIAQRKRQKCPTCGSKCKLIIEAPRVILFPSGWFEHISDEPMYIDSASELREACVKNECYSKYLENSGLSKGSTGQLKEV
ncbi:hypothetical protein CMI37_04185 [Candidatus Pacearchaeota archaeon]|nr:hypothetical protein [Candidatus Pacearchaeota archaeon]